MAAISKAIIVAYYPDKEIVKNYIFKPLDRQSKTIMELAFIHWHYDLIVDKSALSVTTEEKFFDTDVPLKPVSNPVASNLKDSCAKAVGSNNDNIASIEIIDLTSDQVESNNQFSLNTWENVYFNIKPSSTCAVATGMADLSSRQGEKYDLISPYDMDDEEIAGDITYMRKRK